MMKFVDFFVIIMLLVVVRLRLVFVYMLFVVIISGVFMCDSCDMVVCKYIVIFFSRGVRLFFFEVNDCKFLFVENIFFVLLMRIVWIFIDLLYVKVILVNFFINLRFIVFVVFGWLSWICVIWFLIWKVMVL